MKQFFGRLMLCKYVLIPLTLGVFLQGADLRASNHRLQISWFDGRNEMLHPARDGLGFSLPPDRGVPDEGSARRFRLVISNAPAGPKVRVIVVSVDSRTGRVRDRLVLGELSSFGAGRFVTPWLSVVADRDDRNAPSLAGRAVRAGLGDRIEGRVSVGGSRYKTWSMPVGRPPGEDHPLSVRRIRLRATVLKAHAGGPPIAGGDDGGARAVVAHQIRVVNEVLAQCGIWAGDPLETEVILADPPQGALLAVGDRFGLPSAGGVVRLSIDGKRLGPWKVGVGYRPRETAQLLSHRIIEAGFLAEVSPNPKKSELAHGSADIIVRRPDLSLAKIAPWPDAPLTTDQRQGLALGAVTLVDGIDTFDSDVDHRGSLEERTLIKTLKDADSRTVNLFIINRFSSGDKQGESFVRSDGWALQNSVLIDLGALGRARQSYTLAHEIGHILLDDLGHPDARVDRSTERLMHSRSSAAVNGPKRLTRAECEKMRRVSADFLLL